MMVPTTTPLLKVDAPGAIIPPSAPSDALPAWFRLYLENRYMTLMNEVNELRRLLGRNPKRCPHCGGELK